MKSSTYTYDPLDRTTSSTVDGKTTSYNYLGMSSEVLGEEVAGELTKSYQYSPWGERLSQIKHNTDGTSEDGYYGYNSHTDVETLTDKSGDTKATYGYTAYGMDDQSEFSGIDKPDAGNPTGESYNTYRFNAKRWDGNSGTYDMGFRDYDPGLNRFTTRDMYNGALADMGLGTDPFTGNRYAFGGGNPISEVEIDGHVACETGIGPGCIDQTRDTIRRGTSGGNLLTGLIGIAIANLVDMLTDASGDGGGGAGNDDNRSRCEQANGGKREDYGSLDSHGRPSGISMCVDKASIEAGGGTDADRRLSKGYAWAQQFADERGYDPTKKINACHLFAATLGGDGTRPENVSTCSRAANTYTNKKGSDRIDNNMRYFEQSVKTWAMSGYTVLYKVTPAYDGDRVVPWKYDVYAEGWRPDGTQPSLSLQNGFVLNNLDDGLNLGFQWDEDTGAEVPTNANPGVQ